MIDKSNPNWGHDFTDENGRKHTWVKAFGKYLDDLTDEEWDEMSNADCDSALKDCEYTPEND